MTRVWRIYSLTSPSCRIRPHVLVVIIAGIRLMVGLLCNFFANLELLILALSWLFGPQSGQDRAGPFDDLVVDSPRIFNWLFAMYVIVGNPCMGCGSQNTISRPSVDAN